MKKRSSNNEGRKAERSAEREKESAMNPERLIAYKWLKFSEAVILLAVGIVFACFFKNAAFYKAVGYGFSVILLVYGIIELVGSLLIKRSVFSSEIVLGLVVIAVAILLLVYSSQLSNNTQEFNRIITIFFGILIGGYALVLIFSGVINLLPKKEETKKVSTAIIQFIAAAALIGLDITLWIMGMKPGESNPALVLTIAISLMLVGFEAIGNMALAARTQQMLNIVADSRSSQDSSKPENAKEKVPSKKKNPSKAIEEFDATAKLPKPDDKEGEK